MTFFISHKDVQHIDIYYTKTIFIHFDFSYSILLIMTFISLIFEKEIKEKFSQ